MIRRILSFLLLVWAIGFIWFAALPPRPAGDEKTDGIVVLTGGAGRIERGVEALREGWSPAMLVSGVGREVKDAELAAQFDIPARLMRCCITLGYDAVDTRTNAEETAAWIAANDVTSIRLVTADYHMRRAASDLRRQVGSDVTILRDAVHTEPSLAMLFLEYHKLLIGWVAALFDL
ncbi:YdcF family protein [Croceicoccus marinus]|jgi:uncharacterized SAM-binding protein YcdF (DUF218 family)|uniref:YdcF family protein n=1 Tax=Croceicoccus marinus TaxID=450378 RepID=A0A1Z1FD51_9SPHN|nr:YdcF family protein [Croceicoccus marinus]ARU16646.1 hypothetical protein A9D14_11220 [Croceicoccus marinus]QNE05912.1 YdcF family protein [Croceicoccus marinus]